MKSANRNNRSRTYTERTFTRARQIEVSLSRPPGARRVATAELATEAGRAFESIGGQDTLKALTDLRGQLAS